MKLGQLIPGAAVEQSSGPLLKHSSPLLEEEGDFLINALVADFSYPGRINWPGPRSGFAAHNNPVNSHKIQVWKRSQQRF